MCWDKVGGDARLRCVSLPCFPTIFNCCTITAESNPGLFFPPNPNVYPDCFFSGYTTPERLHNPASTSSSTPVQQQRNEREDIALRHGIFAMNSGLGKVRGLLCPVQSQIINLLLQSLQNKKKKKRKKEPY